MFFKAYECFSSTFQAKFKVQGLFKAVLYIQVLFKPVLTLDEFGFIDANNNHVTSQQNGGELAECLYCCKPIRLIRVFKVKTIIAISTTVKR